MRPLFFSLLLGFILNSAAFAEGTLTWPLPPLEEGQSVAGTPRPRIDWLDDLQRNIAAARAQQVDVIFDGDSITAGWRNAGAGTWNQRYAPLNAVDFGIPGDGTQNVLWRLQNGQVDTLNPKLVVLLIGVNNVGGTVNTAEQIADGIKSILGEYQKRCPNAVILLQAIFPWGSGNSEQAPKINEVNERISKFADGKKILFLNFANKFLEPDGSISKEIMPDGLHPGPKGYEIWANAIQPVIDQVLNPSAQSK